MSSYNNRIYDVILLIVRGVFYQFSSVYLFDSESYKIV